MGLDNIPVNYPCKDNAVKDEEGRINCSKTQDEGKCPWKNEFESTLYLKDSKPTYGMFGTDCWYRGKYGNYLTEMLSSRVEHDYHFYGKGLENGEEGLSPEYCLSMSEFMKKHIEDFSYVANGMYPEDSDGYIKDYMYAAWWLEFVGKNCEGSGVWY